MKAANVDGARRRNALATRHEASAGALEFSTPTALAQVGSASTAWGRALNVLNLLAASEGSLSCEQVAERTGMSGDAARAQLRALIRVGLIEAAADQRGYQPGPALHHLEALMSQNHSLSARVQPVLETLVRETGETATYNVLSPDRRSVKAVAKVYGSAALQYELPLGEPKMLVAGAASKAVLAYLDDASKEHAIATQLGSRGATARRRLMDELLAIRTAGYSVTKGEQLPGAVGIGAPVFGYGNGVVGSLVLTLPDFRFDAVPMKKVVKSLIEQAGALSYRLGGDPVLGRKA